jgi:hypothetical protein
MVVEIFRKRRAALIKCGLKPYSGQNTLIETLPAEGIDRDIKRGVDHEAKAQAWGEIVEQHGRKKWIEALLDELGLTYSCWSAIRRIFSKSWQTSTGRNRVGKRPTVSSSFSAVCSLRC